MKKISIVLMFLAAVSSCQKEKETPPSADTLLLSNNALRLNLDDRDLRIWHDDGTPGGRDGINYGCWDTPGNCGRDIVVTPNFLDQMVEVFGTIAAKGAIVESFNNYKDSLYLLLDSTLVDGVIDGSLTVSAVGTDLSVHRYMTFYQKEDSIKVYYVTPFIEGE